MIDFIRISVSTDIINPDHWKDIEFVTPVYLDTGEPLNYSTAKYKNLNIIRLAGEVIFKGSLHKLYNDGKHNYNKFTYRRLVDTLISLCEKFGIDPFEGRINNIEFGVNLPVHSTPTELIIKRLINYKGYSPARNRQRRDKECLLAFEFTNYYLKLYDKSLQYGRSKNILRYEIGTKRMHFLEKTGIQYLSDLFYLDNLRKLRKILLDHFEHFLIVDPVDVRSLSAKAKETYLNGRNPKFWENLRPDPSRYTQRSQDPEYKRQKKLYHRERAKFNNLIIKLNALRTKNILYDNIKTAASKLLSTDTKTRDKITAFLIQYDPNLTRLKNDLYTHYVATNINKIKGQFHPLSNTGKGSHSYVEINKVLISETEEAIRLETVKKVLHEYYDAYYTDHRIMNEDTIQQIMDQCKEDHGLVLTRSEFLKYAKMAEPKDLTCHF